MATSVKLWRKWGFLPNEAKELKNISLHGRQVAYAQAMIRSRRGLKAAAIRYGFTAEEYENAVRRQYEKRGILFDAHNAVWELYKWWEAKVGIQSGYEYPEQRKRRLRAVMKGQNQEVTRRTSRRGLLESLIKDYNISIERATSDYRRNELIKQRDDYQKRLDSLV